MLYRSPFPRGVSTDCLGRWLLVISQFRRVPRNELARQRMRASDGERGNHVPRATRAVSASIYIGRGKWLWGILTCQAGGVCLPCAMSRTVRIRRRASRSGRVLSALPASVGMSGREGYGIQDVDAYFGLRSRIAFRLLGIF
jgi:hypothetical protein